MEDILSMLETLPDEDIKAFIARAQEILLERARRCRLSEDPAIGMWKDRKEMQDSTAWVRHLREYEWQ
ncbi:MAG: DUF2281 domain-containing protein [Candidatus Tectomicrobia bacterium]|nr:DUF2281 domain-containing protein [Candidatus Tectomicrobia bacterium]